MSDKPREPLIGWMIMEDCHDDLSQWDGVISFPDPTGANLAWQNPTKMIEYSAYEDKCKEVVRREQLVLDNFALIKERDEALEKQTQLKIAVDKATDIISAERARSAKLVEERDEARAKNKKESRHDKETL